MSQFALHVFLIILSIRLNTPSTAFTDDWQQQILYHHSGDFTESYTNGYEQNFKERRFLTEEPVVDGNETAEFAAYNMNEQKEALLKEKEALLKEKEPLLKEKEPLIKEKEALLKEKEPLIKEKEPLIKEKEPLIKEKEPLLKEKEPAPPLIKQKKHVTWAPDVKDNSKPSKYKNFLQEYHDYVAAVKTGSFDPEKHLDILTSEILMQFADLNIEDNNVEFIKRTTMATLQKDSHLLAWKINLEGDIKNDNHPANKMVALCREVSMNCSQSTVPENQMMADIMAHIGTCITIINTASVLGHDPNLFLNHELYDLTFEKFLK